MSFFEPPPPPPEEEPEPRYRLPDWAGPRGNVLGMPVATRLVFVHTEKLLVAIVGMTAFPNGLRFSVLMLSKDDSLDDLWMRDMRHHHGVNSIVDEHGQFHPWVFRLGVEFADGRKATNIGGRFGLGVGFDDKSPPEGPLLQDHGGGGGGGHYSHDCWLWPLPPRGRLAFVCAWPQLGVAETRVETEAEPILAAAKESVVLWEDDPDPHSGHGHAHVSMLTARKAAKPPAGESTEQPSPEPPGG